MDEIKKNRKAFEDRIKLLNSNNRLSFVKRYGIDYIIKYIILVINSIGKTKVVKYIFVDEIKNANMNDNLKNTREKFINVETSYMNFYKIDNNLEHLKIGIINPIFLILILLLQLVIILPIMILPYRKACIIIMKIIEFNYSIYLWCINKDQKLKVILMTEHHFFSAVTVNKFEDFTTYILQHGAICDISYYYPIRANYFLAWGKKSKEILYQDEKVICTGTYKFDKLKLENKTSKFKNNEITILWPLRPIENNILKSYMEMFLYLSKKINDINITLVVKKHPSSFSSFEFLKKYNNENINISFVDEKLEKIEFDIAVIDNSTIGYDLFILGKPFIVISSLVEGELIIDYKSYNIPVVSNNEDLYTNFYSYINDSEFIDKYKNSRKLFLREELNDGDCNIKEFVASKY